LQRAIAEFDDRRFRYGKVHASAPASWNSLTPLPIFTAVPIFGFTETAEFVGIIDDFARVAVETLAALEVTTKRPLPLLAMPIIGSGG
ncbi:hypothetical protein K4H00_23850, partial [Mycobacterium tuberculosis]|nr:hypothetical protein [Mycobacterium tuberculosis]